MLLHVSEKRAPRPHPLSFLARCARHLVEPPILYETDSTHSRYSNCFHNATSLIAPKNRTKNATKTHLQGICSAYSMGCLSSHNRGNGDHVQLGTAIVNGHLSPLAGVSCVPKTLVGHLLHSETSPQECSMLAVLAEYLQAKCLQSTYVTQCMCGPHQLQQSGICGCAALSKATESGDNDMQGRHTTSSCCSAAALPTMEASSPVHVM